MLREDVARWIAGYERAWREPGTEALDVYSEWKTVVVNHDPARV